jgi:hypothetical protein
MCKNQKEPDYLSEFLSQKEQPIQTTLEEQSLQTTQKEQSLEPTLFLIEYDKQINL